MIFCSTSTSQSNVPEQALTNQIVYYERFQEVQLQLAVNTKMEKLIILE